MAQIMNFKRMEVSGATVEEAMAKAPFNIMGDATQAYRNWRKTQVNGVTESDKIQFMLDYLNKKSKNVEGVGFSITLESAIGNTRERPYHIEDIKNTSGSRKYKKIFQLIDDATGAVIASTDGTKAEAKELAKDLYVNKDFKSSITCIPTKQVVGGEPVAFKVTYTPSKSSRIGTYLVFGIERQ